MEHRHSPVQAYSLFKSFVIVFMTQAVIVLFTPATLTAQFWYQILALNFLVAIVLGWYLYKYSYHMVLSYDNVGFQLRKGRSPPVTHKWSEFLRVSLVRGDYGEFMVRLHGSQERFEIPVSKLKLDPFQFRLQVMNYVAKATSA